MAGKSNGRALNRWQGGCAGRALRTFGSIGLVVSLWRRRHAVSSLCHRGCYQRPWTCISRLRSLFAPAITRRSARYFRVGRVARGLGSGFACYILDAQGACTLAPNSQAAHRRAGGSGGLAIVYEAEEGTVNRADDQEALHGDIVACLRICRCESWYVRARCEAGVGVSAQSAHPRRRAKIRPGPLCTRKPAQCKPKSSPEMLHRARCRYKFHRSGEQSMSKTLCAQLRYVMVLVAVRHQQLHWPLRLIRPAQYAAQGRKDDQSSRIRCRASCKRTRLAA